MTRRALTGALGVAAALLLAVPVPAAEKGQPVKVGDYTLTGPYTHENLTIFLIHGPDRLKGKSFLTLQEALEQKKVVVHEIGNVNQLAVENVSPDADVFIQSGDIVKGGQQDRLFAFDVILPPRSGKVPIGAFCVESGRWSQRGNENRAEFAASISQAPSKDIKLYAKGEAPKPLPTGGVAGVVYPNQQPGQANPGAPAGQGAQIHEPAQQQARANQADQQAQVLTRQQARMNPQSGVWTEVGNVQKKLRMNLKSEVQAEASRSSLQLTLENKKLQEAVDAYLAKLLPAAEGKADVVGYAFAINGKVNSADVYAAHALFQKLWPRLLRASVVEAIGEQDHGKKFEPAKAEAVKACLQDAEKGKPSTQDVTARVKVQVQKTEKNVLFETRDQDQKGVWVHRNYIAY